MGAEMAGANKIKMAADIIDIANKVAPIVKSLVDNLDTDAVVEKIATGSKTAAKKKSVRALMPSKMLRPQRRIRSPTR